MANENIEQKADISLIKEKGAKADVSLVKEKNIRARLVYAGRGKPDSTQNLEDELLDWDACIRNPPKPCRSDTIKVTLRYVGRSKPIPLDDPYM